ncbi:MAG: hypothetical protein GQ525_07470 [Draconibacterium sp.]|nr:hypothetical protein [Draconibacterium sp.]
MVIRFTPATLDIEAAYAVYLPLYGNEAEALDVIRKSAITDEIADADHLRDLTYRGLCDTVKGATKHFLPAKQEAAERVQVAIDHFGNINTKPYNEQTASINTLVNDLETEYADDINTLNMQDWITELKAKNEAFEALMDERYSDDAGKTQLKMKDVRKEIDEAYTTITDRIDALGIVNGTETYAPFVKELNKRVEKFNNTLAIRKGRNGKDDSEEV